MLFHSVLVALMKTGAHCGTQCYLRCHFCDYCKTGFPKRAPKLTKEIKHTYKAWDCLHQKVHAHLCSHTCMYILTFRLQRAQSMFNIYTKVIKVNGNYSGY